MNYVALTPLDAQWLREEPVACAGPWCVEEAQQQANSSFVSGPSSEEELFQLAEKAFRTYEEIIPHVCATMNEVHGVNKSRRYWEIIVEYALRLQIGAFVDRYDRIRTLERKNPGCRVKVLNETSYEIIRSGRDFEKRALFSDYFNLQIFSQIADATDLTCERVQGNTFSRWRSVSDQLRHLKRSFHNRFQSSPQGFNPSVAICSYGLSFELTERVDERSKRQVKYLFHDFQPEIPPYDSNMRSIFRRETNLEGLSRYVFRSLEWNMPLPYLEGYQHLQEFIRRHQKKTPDLVIRQNPKSHPLVHTWVAECVEDGAKLATAQHGSSYGELEVSVHEKLEKNTSDIYITWGREFEPKEVPLPSKRLHVTREELSPRKDPSNGGILWASRAPRFFRAHGYTPKVGAQLNLGPPQRHIDGVLAFGSHLSPDVAAKTIFRLKPSRLMELEDFKEDVELKITSAIEKLSLDTGGRSFAEQARDVELVVVDHFPSTAFLECIALDFPVIAFNMIPMTRIREETRPHVNVLQRQRVVHEDPEDAAHLVNELMGGEERTVEDWWQKTERRRAVSTYRKMFARTSDDFVGEWAEFVDRVVCNKKK